MCTLQCLALHILLETSTILNLSKIQLGYSHSVPISLFLHEQKVRVLKVFGIQHYHRGTNYNMVLHLKLLDLL